LSTVGEPFSMLKDDQKIGLEGQSILKKDGYYYLFYSSGNCCGAQCDYNVRVGRSKSFAGPYEQFPGNPLLQENAFWKCSGHGTFVTGANGRCYYLYHAYNKENTVFAGRQGMLAELLWPEKNGWPVFKERSGPALNSDVKLNFKNPSIDKGWQWDFRNSTTTVSQKDGKIHLSDKINKDNLTGIALTRRPLSAVFEAETVVSDTNQALKGLTYYGDANAAMGIGMVGNTVQFWTVKGKESRVQSSAQLKGNAPVALKMKIMADHRVLVFFKQGSNDWENLKTDEQVTTDFLPQWDRSPRIGLHFRGEVNQEAAFSSFSIKYSL